MLEFKAYYQSTDDNVIFGISSPCSVNNVRYCIQVKGKNRFFDDLKKAFKYLKKVSDLYIVIYTDNLFMREMIFHKKDEAQKFADLKNGTFILLPKKSKKS